MQHSVKSNLYVFQESKDNYLQAKPGTTITCTVGRGSPGLLAWALTCQAKQRSLGMYLLGFIFSDLFSVWVLIPLPLAGFSGSFINHCLENTKQDLLPLLRKTHAGLLLQDASQEVGGCPNYFIF